MTGDEEAQVIAEIEQALARLKLESRMYRNQAGRETRQTFQRDAKVAAMRAHRAASLDARDEIIAALMRLYR